MDATKPQYEKGKRIMCLNPNGNRELACTVGDLKPGQQYRTPGGNTLMVLDSTPSLPGATMVANIATGEVISEPSYIKLGHDRRHRLYASRFLNPDDGDK